MVRVKEGKGGAAFEEGEDSMGDLVDGQVFADISLGSFPQEEAFSGVELDQERAMTLGGPEGRFVGN